MIKVNNLLDGENIKILEEMNGIKVLEHQKDQSIIPELAQVAYFSKAMNIKKRQLYIELDNNSFTTSQGAMQWMAGNLKCTSNVKGVGDFFGKALKGAMVNESTSKPVYSGKGILMLEPTYKHILLEDMDNWGGSLIVDDGLFMACDSTVTQKLAMRTNLSSAVFGNQGLFNLSMNGKGIVALESPVPRNELIEVHLEDDEIRIDGNFAIAWSSTLNFTVEKSTKSLVGSAVSGEGFVNVYRGSGRILIAPVSSYPINTISSVVPSSR